MKSQQFQFSKPLWKVLKDTKVFETPIFSLHQVHLLTHKSEEQVPFYVLKAPDWINIIALTAENEVVLVEQYRAGIHEPSLEIPGGMVDDGENHLEAAKRELLEETGYISDSWKIIGKASSNPAILTNFTHLYLAVNCRKVQEQQTDGNEDIKVHVLPLNEFLSLVKEGTVHHSIVLAAVAHYLLQNMDLS
jgi:ADP-ribose pyrophosphatase